MVKKKIVVDVYYPSYNAWISVLYSMSWLVFRNAIFLDKVEIIDAPKPARYVCCRDSIVRGVSFGIEGVITADLSENK